MLPREPESQRSLGTRRPQKRTGRGARAVTRQTRSASRSRNLLATIGGRVKLGPYEKAHSCVGRHAIHACTWEKALTAKPDDLEAVRSIVTTLSPFEASEQERILRWSREKLGLPVDPGTSAPSARQLDDSQGVTPPASSPPHGPPPDIKSFVAEKAPTSNNEFAATVAYYYRFEAPEAARKEAISADDLQEACRLAGRTRLRNPGQTLINAHQVGLVDKSGDRGAYAISTVGENLVAMTLPSDASKTGPSKASPAKKARSRSAGKAGRPKKTSRKRSNRV